MTTKPKTAKTSESASQTAAQQAENAEGKAVNAAQAETNRNASQGAGGGESGAKGSASAETNSAAARTVAAIQVVAPGGPRRRAGLAFGPAPVVLTEEDLGATSEEREARLKALFGDPMLSVSPVQSEGR